VNRHVPAPTTPRGFTLIEMMVVLVLIGILTAMIIPAMRGTYEDSLLRSTSRRLIDLCDLAYSRAVSSSEPCRVRLDPATGHYVLESATDPDARGGDFLPVDWRVGEQGKLDRRVSIQVRQAEEDPAAATGSEPRLVTAAILKSESQPDTISFYPDGTADAAEIVLRDRDGFRLGLRIDPITARVRVIELARQ
jgi:type II secretion system protein H